MTYLDSSYISPRRKPTSKLGCFSPQDPQIHSLESLILRLLNLYPSSAKDPKSTAPHLVSFQYPYLFESSLSNCKIHNFAILSHSETQNPKLRGSYMQIFQNLQF